MPRKAGKGKGPTMTKTTQTQIQYDSFFINTRKARRARARHKMKAEGVQHINRRPWLRNPTNGMMLRGDSLFADNWREYAPKAQTARWA